MCHTSCFGFGKKVIKEEFIKGKSIIEVGSMNINGSFRSIVESFGPSEYMGVDIKMGSGVDQICACEDLVVKFGCNRFDMVICTELLEHVNNWEKVIHNLKHVIKPGGMLLVTTRSKGMFYHGYPFDFWRYEISDIERIFSDLDIKISEKDYEIPGVFLLAVKPSNFIENKFDNLELYSMVLGRRSSIIAANIYWILLNIPLKILGLSKNEYYYSRIVYFNSHPFAIFEWLTRKLRTYCK